MKLQPFFTYFGGKYRAAPRYPAPRYRTIIEPFAGSAGYALRHPDKQVLLIEKNETLVGVWDYLIHVSAEEVRRLPDLRAGERTQDLKVSPEARALIGFWLNKGSAAPGKSPSAWMRAGTHANSFWGPRIRQRIAQQVEAIRHWRVQWGDYTEALDIPATWFVDPPYQKAGKDYRCSASDLDFAALGEWCLLRKGQVMVCENSGADWLPFQPFHTIKGCAGKFRSQVSKEALYYKDGGRVIWS